MNHNHRFSGTRHSAFRYGTQCSRSTQVGAEELEAKTNEEGPKTLGSQMKTLCREYRTTATIHGVPRINGPLLYSYRRILWSLLVFGLAAVLIMMMYLQLSRFNEYPIKTSVKVKYLTKMDFPAVTICNMNHFRREEIPENQTLHTYLYYASDFTRFFPNAAGSPNPFIPEDKDISGQELLAFSKRAAHRLNGILFQCQWRGTVYPCEELFVPKMTSQGLCYTFNHNGSNVRQAVSVGPNQGLMVTVDLQQKRYYFSSTIMAGIRVVVHLPGSTPFPERQGWTFRPGISANVALSREEKHGLPPPYKALANSTCLDEDSEEGRTFLNRYKYTLNACATECIYDFIIATCGCTHYNDPGYKNGTSARLCSAKEMLECYFPTMKSSDVDFLQLCSCPWGCKTISFSPIITYADFNSRFIDSYLKEINMTTSDQYTGSNGINLDINFHSMGILIFNQEPEISVGEIFGTIGGQMGLFLGASVLSLTEIGELLVLLTIKSISTLLSRMTMKRVAHDEKTERSKAEKTNGKNGNVYVNGMRLEDY